MQCSARATVLRAPCAVPWTGTREPRRKRAQRRGFPRVARGVQASSGGGDWRAQEEEQKTVEEEMEPEKEGIGHIAQLALPALVVVLSDPLQTLVDSAVLGRYSTLHLAAIGPNTTLFNSVFQLFAFLGVTVANTVSGMVGSGGRRMTSKRAIKAQRTFHTAVILALILGSITVGVIHISSVAILTYMNTSARVIPFALEYMHVRAIGTPIVLMMNAFQGLCLGQQDTRLPMAVCSVVTALNIALDLFLVAVRGQGARGAAVATVVAQACGLMLMVYLIKRKHHIHGGVDYMELGSPGKMNGRSVSWRDVQLAAAEYGPILKKFATMAAILIARTSVGILAYLSMSTEAMRMGIVAAASHQISMQLFWFLSYLPEPLSMAAQVKMAKDVPGNSPRATRTKRLFLVLGCAMGIVLAASTAASFTLLPPLFTSDPSIIAQVKALRPLGTLAIAICSVLMVYDGMSIGAQKLIHLPIGVGLGFVAVLIVLKTRLAFIAGIQIPGGALASVWMALVAFYTIRLLAHLVYYGVIERYYR